MKAQELSSTGRELNISVQDADVGTLYVVQHELLSSPTVDFAGVIVKHPLTNECWMRVTSYKGDPSKEVEKAVAAALKATEALRDAFGSKLGKQA